MGFEDLCLICMTSTMTSGCVTHLEGNASMLHHFNLLLTC
nr:hypothetical protein Iba_chr11eCG6680 [Ipomoea batatas]